MFCIATYRKGDEFLKECRRQGCRVLLLTEEKLRSSDWPREAVDDVPPGLEDAARTAARACGLVCWGADFLLGADGPVLVDVNAFPGYRGVPEGPDWVADAVLAALGRG